jgi:TonB family protein
MHEHSNEARLRVRFDFVRLACAVCALCALGGLPTLGQSSPCPPAFPEGSVRNPVYLPCQTTSAAAWTQRSPSPGYPRTLVGGGIEGVVETQFIIDAHGRIDTGTVRIFKSTHPDLDLAVRRAVPGWRARPARLHGAAVRQLMKYTFRFVIAQRGQACRARARAADTGAPDATTVVCAAPSGRG